MNTIFLFCAVFQLGSAACQHLLYLASLSAPVVDVRLPRRAALAGCPYCARS